MSTLFEDIMDSYSEILTCMAAVFICVLCVIVFLTFPLWVGPYLLIKWLKGGRKR